MTRGSQAGTTSLELVLLAPVLLSVMLLIAAFGRHANVQGHLDQAARDAARSATSSRDADSAGAAVQATIDAALASAPPSCRDSETHEVTTTQTDGLFLPSSVYDPEEIVVITITVKCDVGVSDLSFIGFGQLHLTSTFSSPMPALYGVYP